MSETSPMRSYSSQDPQTTDNLTSLVSPLRKTTENNLFKMTSLKCVSYDHRVCQAIPISEQSISSETLKQKVPKQWGYNLPTSTEFSEEDEEDNSSGQSVQKLLKKRVCSFQPLFSHYELQDEPIFIIWGNCNLDLRASWDLDYQKEAGWNKFIKMGKVKACKQGVSYTMSQMVMPNKSLKQIKDTLIMQNNQQCKELADLMTKYEEVIAGSINYMQITKQQFLGKEDELEKLQQEKQLRFDEQKKRIQQMKEDEGVVYLTITSCIDIKMEQILFREVQLSNKFLNLMGVTQQEFQQISLRKGGLEFFQVGEHVNHAKNVLDLVVSGKKQIEFEAQIKTYDNINLSVTINFQIIQPNEDLPFFVGGDYLLVQTFTLSPNMLNYLHATRQAQIRNPFIEWEHDFKYTNDASELVQMFYQEQMQVLKKKQKITQKYIINSNTNSLIENSDKMIPEENDTDCINNNDNNNNKEKQDQN